VARAKLAHVGQKTNRDTAVGTWFTVNPLAVDLFTPGQLAVAGNIQ
jgi:hypothetical protein